MNNKISSLQLLACLLSSFSLLLIPGLADETSDDNKSAASKMSTTLTILIVLVGLLAVAAFSLFLYKLWQRKKREEQHARLLKLFEQDDELEVELGIRD
ncbi:hypothetical protein CASFOL_016428 [Castilleja foliolosa]|uniref:Uncharacterized protein n=1 Tax=Castilleja foliolosa TaxID=1961234 RepID=A0ABD3DGK1_9LAMI